MGRRILVLVASLALLATACSSGPVRRISEPAASIQQLTVQADGGWRLALRLQNYSSIPMRFDAVDLRLGVGGEAAGTLAHRPGVEIGPGSADVVEVALQPGSSARMLLADALAERALVVAAHFALPGHIERAGDGGMRWASVTAG